MIKKIIKGILPNFILTKIRSTRVKRDINTAYRYDSLRFFKYSSSLGFDTEPKLKGEILKGYHVIEKGLTMPEPRIGFGQEKIVSLSQLVCKYYKLFGSNDEQIQHAVSVILEYADFHAKHGADSLADKTSEAIREIEKIAEDNKLGQSQQVRCTKDEYFSKLNSSFEDFSNSRRSIRNYSEEVIPEEVIKKAIELSLNTPSACNRQTYRVYVYSTREGIDKVFQAQNGNRGFGQLADKLIVITAELGVFAQPMERNQAFIDGGMYVMNLLYCLHAHGIAACTLNCSNTPETDEKLYKICNISESEVFIAMLSCGIPPQEFSVALSKRYELKDILIYK